MRAYRLELDDLNSQKEDERFVPPFIAEQLVNVEVDEVDVEVKVDSDDRFGVSCEGVCRQTSACPGGKLCVICATSTVTPILCQCVYMHPDNCKTTMIERAILCTQSFFLY